jgi:hypothetical protein
MVTFADLSTVSLNCHISVPLAKFGKYLPTISRDGPYMHALFYKCILRIVDAAAPIQEEGQLYSTRITSFLDYLVFTTSLCSLAPLESFGVNAYSRTSIESILILVY